MKKRSVAEFRKPGLILSKSEVSSFARAWVAHEIEQDEESSSISAVDEAILFGAKENPDVCFDLIISICSITDDKDLLLTLGVGSLEDLMRINGKKLEYKVKQEYSKNSSFRKALECVYLTEEVESYNMVKSLIGEFQYL